MIEYSPPKLGEKPPLLFRKTELRRLTREYCDKLKSDKLEEYHKQLIEEQKEFEQKKKQIENWIESEEKFLGLTSDHNINVNKNEIDVKK